MKILYGFATVFVLTMVFMYGMLYESYQSNYNTYQIGECVRKLGSIEIYKVNLVPNKYETELSYPSTYLKGGIGYRLVDSKDLVKVSCEK